MAGTAKDYTVSEIICGYGNLWAIGVAPTNSAVQLTLSANGTPDATAHPGSVHLGMVESSIVTAAASGW